jgi:hypothetical protein
LIGLYNRFKKEEGEFQSNETPIDFERFVARIVEINGGGHAKATQATGDHG